MTTDNLTVLRATAQSAIDAELAALGSRAVLDRAVRESIVKLGASIDAVSEASGLAPDEIRRILARKPILDDLASFAGTAA